MFAMVDAIFIDLMLYFFIFIFFPTEKPFVAFKVRSHSTRQVMHRCQAALRVTVPLLLFRLL